MVLYLYGITFESISTIHYNEYFGTFYNSVVDESSLTYLCSIKPQTPLFNTGLNLTL